MSIPVCGQCRPCLCPGKAKLSGRSAQSLVIWWLGRAGAQGGIPGWTCHPVSQSIRGKEVWRQQGKHFCFTSFVSNFTQIRKNLK
jgi:hypothetical protein